MYLRLVVFLRDTALSGGYSTTVPLAPSTDSPIERFGSEVFNTENGTKSRKQIPCTMNTVICPGVGLYTKRYY